MSDAIMVFIHTKNHLYLRHLVFSLNLNKTQCGFTFAKRQMFQENKYYDKENRIAIKMGSDCWIGEEAFLVGI